MIDKETRSLGMPWEQDYGYSQAVKVENTIYISGKVSHDIRNIVCIERLVFPELMVEINCIAKL